MRSSANRIGIEDETALPRGPVVMRPLTSPKAEPLRQTERLLKSAETLTRFPIMRRSAYYRRSGSYSRSYRAEVAESEGRAPMSRAKVTVAAEFGCSQSVAQAALNFLHDGEWHHVGKFANRVDYFDATDERLGGMIRHILACGGAKKWAVRRERLRTDRRFGGKLNGYVYSPAPGRIVAMQDRAAKTRATAEAAFNRPIVAGSRTSRWNALQRAIPKQLPGSVPETQVVLRGREVWSDDRIAFALADHGCQADRIISLFRGTSCQDS